MNDPEKAKDEFLSEAEEIFEALGRDLAELDQQFRAGSTDPEVVNDIFRAVHTLKGLSGLFGASDLGVLSHALETRLDAVRLGREGLSAELIDLFFKALDVAHRILVADLEGQPPPRADVERVRFELTQESTSVATDTAASGQGLDMDPSIFAVLTEYEEHRLRSNIEAGTPIYRLRVRFGLLTIDESLDQLKAAAKPLGEIITYLPTGEGADADSIELDILMASSVSAAQITGVLSPLGAQVIEIPRSIGAPNPRPRAEIQPLVGEPPSKRVGSSHPPVDLAIGTIRSVTQTVRVDIQKLDRLMNAVSELAIVKASVDRIFDRIKPLTTDRARVNEMVRLSRTFDRQLESMQQGILEVRMVPLGQLFERLSRVARQVGTNAKKQFNLVVTGAETEVDKLIVEELSDPLMHMMRNAIDHGIESVEARIAVGKPEVGTIALNAFQRGNHVLIELEDDGSGIDTERVIEVALARGLISPGDVRSTSRREILNLIFLPGLSTRTTVDELSGRGVGMDVVKTNISKLGGVVDVQSEVGIGTKFAVTLPITLAIVRVLVAEVSGHTLAIPLANVREAVTLDLAGVFTVDGYEAISLRGTTLRLCRLSQVLELGEPEVTPKHQYVVVTVAGSRKLGLVVDRLVGSQDVVMKALGKSLAGVRGFAGAADFGEEHLGLVLDTPSLYEEVVSWERRRLAKGVS